MKLVCFVQYFVGGHETLGSHDFTECGLDIVHSGVWDGFTEEHVFEDVFEAGVVDSRHSRQDAVLKCFVACDILVQVEANFQVMGPIYNCDQHS